MQYAEVARCVYAGWEDGTYWRQLVTAALDTSAVLPTDRPFCVKVVQWNKRDGALETYYRAFNTRAEANAAYIHQVSLLAIDSPLKRVA